MPFLFQSFYFVVLVVAAFRVEMEISVLKVLLGSISSFLNLSSSRHIDLDPFEKYYKRVEELLRVLKPIAEAVINSDLVLEEKLGKAFEELTQDVDQSRDLFRSWQAFSSKVYFVRPKFSRLMFV